jgi:hypothetical protein
VVFAAASGFAGAAHGASEPLARFAVGDVAGVSRARTLVTLGVPLAEGRLAAADGATLRDAAGRSLPFDTRALERWPDGSVRWLLLDALVTVPARGRQSLTLVAAGPAPGVAPDGALVVNRASAGPRMDAGAVVATVHRDGPQLLSLALPGGGPTVSLAWPQLGVDGAAAPAPRVERVDVETRGTVRAEVVVRARGASGLAHEVRIATFAGLPHVRLRYTLTNLGDAPYVSLSALPLVLPWRAQRAELVIDGKTRGFDIRGAERRHAVTHRDAARALLDGAPAGRHADGAARVSGGGAAWSVVVPDFWQEYPKSLSVSDDELVVDLAAAAHEPLLLGVGAAKTWEVWLAAHPDDSPPPLGTLHREITSPPSVALDAATVARSGAVPYALTPSGPGAVAFVGRFREQLERYRARATAERWDDGPPGPCTARTTERVRVGFYGALNWGDWNFPGFRDRTKGCDAWGNLEYDMPLVLGLAYLASGDAATWTLFDTAARHYRDVDLVHHWPGFPNRVGLNHPHKVRHFATDAQNTTDLGHVWLDGLLLHYRLTGEERSRAAVVRMADALAALPDRARNPRQFGWPMVALAAAFEATGEARYRDACLAFASRAGAAFPPDPNAEWKTGVLAEGMAAAHRATGDASVRAWLDEYGRRLLEPPPAPRDPRLVSPAGYLYGITGDERYATLARDTAAALELGTWGKVLASMGRVGFGLLAPLGREPVAVTRDRGGPPRVSAAAPRRPSPSPGAPSPPSDR